MTSLLERFLREESPPDVLALVEEKMREAERNNLLEEAKFNFNVFDVVLHLKHGQATLYDVLNPPAEQVMSLEEFTSALAHNNSLKPRTPDGADL